MEPAWTQFESKSNKQFSIVMINVDDRKSAEFTKYGDYVKKAGAIPYTMWIDSKGTVLGDKSGALDEATLSRMTAEYARKAR